MKKSKQFNQSDIASDIAALTLTFSVDGCYIWVFLGFLEIVPEEQRKVGSVMLQFI